MAVVQFSPAQPVRAPEREDLHLAFRTVRARSLALTRGLSSEDQLVQSMPEVSPTKWHLAHVTWFFETFILKAHAHGYRPFHPGFEHLFNSYYNSVGEMHARPRRGLLSRPSHDEVLDYRAFVDEKMLQLLETAPTHLAPELSRLTILGLNHEEQHQELMMTDIKHVLSCNPLLPAAFEAPAPARSIALEDGWAGYEGGFVMLGHAGDGFAFDNETPRHKVWLRPFSLRTRPVSNRDYLAFIEDGGYDAFDLWLSDGWAVVKSEGWEAPLYWTKRDGEWHEFTLAGLRPLDLDAPVAHVSYYEADAFARWAGARLPSEAELEIALRGEPITGNVLPDVEDGAAMLAPMPRAAEHAGNNLMQAYGDVWEWTASDYAAYPGFAPVAGALGEYNGKFMCNQFVLKGGSCATPHGHVRASYRNFFYPKDRWQFTGLRLAKPY
jgi:ergothioneine biosynthesis protein EgtB